ncbi:MAG: DUF2064 domain-containing protein [Candidatus Zixiibacteriota bacterium]
MAKEKTNDTVLAICIQEIKEDGSELRIYDVLRAEDIEFLHQAFIADTIVNITDLSLVDFHLFYGDSPKTNKAVKIIIKYLDEKLGSKKGQALKDRLKITKLKPERWGLKMEHIFNQCFKDGYKHVLLIGSRTPTLKSDRLNLALKLLKNSDAVFGPTVEGRYYLIGLSGQYHFNLSDFDWSSPTIYSEVANRFREQGLTWSELEIWYTVENHDALEFLVRDINQYRFEGDEVSAKETEMVLGRILNR